MRDAHKHSTGALGSLVAQNKKPFIGAMFSTMMAVVINLATPMLLAETIDSVLGSAPSRLPAWLIAPVVNAGGREWLIRHFWVLGALLVLLNLIGGVFNYLKGRWTAVASENIALTLREKLYAHLQHLPFSYHVHAETGDIIQRCTSDVDTIRRFLSVQLMEVVNALLMVAASLTVMLRRHVTLTFLSMALVPFLFTFAMWFFRRVRKQFRQVDEAEGRMSAVLQENLTGVRVVRAFGQQEREVEKFEQVSHDFYSKNVRLNDLLAVYWGGGDALSMLQQLFTMVMCVLFALRGEITVGTLIVFNSYVGQLLFPIRQLGRILSDAGKSQIAMERIQGILQAPAEEEEPDALKPDLHGDIVFDHVSFAYEDDHIPVLHDICCTIPAGKTTAILGATGSGKSTMMYLLQRLYAPTSGRITINGYDIRQIDRAWLRSHIGLILQEPFLYSKSIRDNVGIASPNPEAEAVRHAASIASATGFIEDSEQGWDTLVGERGVTLSGGQKQRVAIARTLLKDNTALIFDDSLSAVDTETDAQIRKALNRENRGMTTLIISHRVTTLSQADQILVIENGRITQRGTHEELRTQEGLYRRIDAIQSGLEDAEDTDNTTNTGDIRDTGKEVNI